MFLVISDGGAAAHALSNALDSCGAEYVYQFETLAGAGEFGHGSVIVGKITYRGLKRVINKNNVTAVIDTISVPQSETSLVVQAVADDLKIPVIKIIAPTVRFDALRSADVKADFSVNYSYKDIAAKINNTVGNAVFFAKPYNVRAIADLVFDQKELFVPIKSGASFDVDLALEFGIPILNVREFESFSGVSGIKRVLEEFDAKLMITDSEIDIYDKLSAAEMTGAEVVFTQNTGIEYELIFDNLDSFCEFLRSSELLNSGEPQDENAVSEENGGEEEPENQNNI